MKKGLSEENPWVFLLGHDLTRRALACRDPPCLPCLTSTGLASSDRAKPSRACPAAP